MHEFKYRNSELYCESARVADIARKIGTPLYLYSYKTIIDHYTKLKQAFAPIRPLICYSMKANSNLAIINTLVRHGAGLDIVSGGELFRALKVNVNPKKIVYASVGKTEQEIRDALKAGILFFNVESIPELEAINRIARSLHVVAQVCIRINPDVEPGTHKLITTGKLTNKFGIDFPSALKIFSRRFLFDNVEIKGVHLHIGSQIISSTPFISALRKVLHFIDGLSKVGADVEYLNIGGGLGIIYSNEKPQTAQEFASAVLPLLKGRRLKLILEPGRFIIGNAGILVARVTYVKKTAIKNFVIVDAAMNDLIRPALYEAHHEIVPLTKRAARPRHTYDVVGPVCESGDFLAKDRQLAEVGAGELLAVMSVGAYGASMASNYNARRRLPEIMVKGSRFYVVRERETYKDLIRKERIPRQLR